MSKKEEEEGTPIVTYQGAYQGALTNMPIRRTAHLARPRLVESVRLLCLDIVADRTRVSHGDGEFGPQELDLG